LALYYFHVTDGATILDDHGSNLPDLAAVRRTALATSLEMLGGMKAGPMFWSGEPWKLWVTDEPNGGGATLLTLQFEAAEGELHAHEKNPVTAPDLHS
jgi:hypothetical protein